ncbi:MAG: glycosyltransferase family 2 protein [Candidatus Xenobia bacterium]
MRVFAIIPAYNEDKRVAQVVARTRPMVERVVVVDDGSKDRTAEVARAAGADVVVQPQNAGKGAALNAGFDYCVQEGADAVVTLDADLQHLPEDIPKFVSALEHGADVAVGSRAQDLKRMPPLRRATNVVMSVLLSWIAGQRMEDTQSGYRIYRSEVVRQVRCTSNRFEAESEVLLRASRRGFKLAWVPIEAIYLEGRQSHIHPVRDTFRFIAFLFRMAREPRD